MTTQALLDVPPGTPIRVGRRVAVRSSGARWFARSVAASVALGSLWLLLFAVVLTRVEEVRSQHVLYARFRQQLAEATAPVQGPIQPGAPVALLSVPSIGLSHVVVVEGGAGDQLKEGPGHRRDTVLPGQAGVSVVQGRSVTYGGVFRRVPDLVPGAAVTVVTGQGSYTYHVTGVRHGGDAVSAPAPGSGRLTLVTSEGSRWSPSRTVLVDASLEQPVTPEVAGGAAAAERPMATDSSVLMPLVLWLEAVLAVALGAVWSARRWGGRQTWLVAGVVLVASFWGASDAAAALLPNLL